MVAAAAAAGKQVLCERPFALRKADAERSVASIDAAGVVLGLNYNRRLHPEMVNLRDRIDSGDLGTILERYAEAADGTQPFMIPDACSLARRVAKLVLISILR